MIPSWLKIAASVAVLGLAIVAPLWYWSGGILELEVLQFIQQYLDDRSLAAKVFDPVRNDFGTYQGRELSYFIDYLDARVFEVLMRRGWLAFAPASSIVASVASTAIIVWSLRRYAIGIGLSTLLALVYLTNYVHVVTMGLFYRATKPLVAPLLLATVFYVVARLRDLPASDAAATGRRLIPGLTLLALLLPMGLLDRQGHFYALGAAALLGAWTVRDRRAWPMAAGAATAAGLVTLYNWWIGPVIIHAVNGYYPSFEYQRIPAEHLWDAESYRKAGAMLAENMTILLGSTSSILSAIGVLSVIAVGLPRVPNRRTRQLVGAAIVAVLASQVLMFGLMIVRHPMVYDWIDHRYWYYPLPFLALMFAGLCLLLAPALRSWTPSRRTIVAGVLALVIAGNLSHWTAYRDLMMNSRWFYRVYPQTMMLRQSLRANDPDPRLIIQYFRFYEYCQSLRK